MKGFAIVLLCALAVVQGRSTGTDVQTSSRDVSAADSPWLLHLRLAVATSGFLRSCAGSLIDARWVLTSASCVRDGRFVWARYGTIDVINPELVTESNQASIRHHPNFNSWTGENDVALISLNRNVESTDTIAPAALSSSELTLPETASFCGFGRTEAGNPGETRVCFDVTLQPLDRDSFLARSEDGEFTEFDIGAPLVSEGQQIGILADPSGRFIIPTQYVDWINSETGLNL